MSISSKIMGGYIVVLVLLTLVAGVAFYALGQAQASYNDFLNVDARLKERAGALRTAAFAQQTFVRGLLLYPELDQQNLSFLEENNDQFKQVFFRMRKLISGNEGIALVDGLESVHGQLEQAQRAAIGLVLEQRREEALTFVREKFRPLSLALVDKAKHFHQWQSTLLEKRKSE